MEALRTIWRRLGGWISVAVCAIAVIAVIAPQQLSVLAFKFTQVILAVVVGYYADKSLYRTFDGKTIDVGQDIVMAARLLGRAIIVLAVLLALTIGL